MFSSTRASCVWPPQRSSEREQVAIKPQGKQGQTGQPGAAPLSASAAAQRRGHPAAPEPPQRATRRSASAQAFLEPASPPERDRIRAASESRRALASLVDPRAMTKRRPGVPRGRCQAPQAGGQKATHQLVGSLDRLKRHVLAARQVLVHEVPSATLPLDRLHLLPHSVGWCRVPRQSAVHLRPVRRPAQAPGSHVRNLNAQPWTHHCQVCHHFLLAFLRRELRGRNAPDEADAEGGAIRFVFLGRPGRLGLLF